MAFAHPFWADPGAPPERRPARVATGPKSGRTA